jgi:hypothetical protein
MAEKPVQTNSTTIMPTLPVTVVWVDVWTANSVKPIALPVNLEASWMTVCSLSLYVSESSLDTLAATTLKAATSSSLRRGYRCSTTHLAEPSTYTLTIKCVDSPEAKAVTNGARSIEINSTP